MTTWSMEFSQPIARRVTKRAAERGMTPQEWMGWIVLDALSELDKAESAVEQVFE